MKKNNPKIDFALPEDTSLVDVIYDILEKNNIKQSDEEFIDKVIQRKEESRVVIIRDAAVTVFQKKISESKVVELLQKHLETSKEIAEKIVADIKEKLIPYAQIIDTNKKTDAIDIQETKEDLQKARTVIPQTQQTKGPDTYREPIE